VKWILEHLVFPGILVFGGIISNNIYQNRKQPHLTDHKEVYQIMKVSEDKFKIKCPFTILNDGGSTIENTKVTFILPKSVSIDAIDISERYKSFYDIKDGGLGYNHVVISINLPKARNIEGAIIGISNIKIPEKSMSPLEIIY
jgi:hypothetical protein